MNEPHHLHDCVTTESQVKAIRMTNTDLLAVHTAHLTRETLAAVKVFISFHFQSMQGVSLKVLDTVSYASESVKCKRTILLLKNIRFFYVMVQKILTIT